MISNVLVFAGCSIVKKHIRRSQKVDKCWRECARSPLAHNELILPRCCAASVDGVVDKRQFGEWIQVASRGWEIFQGIVCVSGRRGSIAFYKGKNRIGARDI